MFAPGLLRIRRSRSLRTVALCILLLLCMAGAAQPAFGQTASLLYTHSDVATGLNNPQGVAVDASGNVYIADLGDNRVLNVTIRAPAVALSVTFNPAYGVGGQWIAGFPYAGDGAILRNAATFPYLKRYRPSGTRVAPQAPQSSTARVYFPPR